MADQQTPPPDKIESKLRDQTDRGERARLVLAELEAAMKALEKDCFETFRRSEIDDDDGRTMCRLYLKVLDDVRGRFTRAVVIGEAARKELVRKKDPSKLRKIINATARRLA